MRQDEVICCTLGTRGDFDPFATLAVELRELGLNVTVLSNENWSDEANAIGIAFDPIAPEDPSQSGRDDLSFFRKNIVPSYERVFRRIENLCARGRRPIVVWKNGMHGAQAAAEKFNLTNAKVLLQPSALRSCHRPPWPLTSLARGPLGPLARHFLIPLLYAAAGLDNGYGRHISSFRGGVSLPMKRPTRRTGEAPDLTLVMCPSWFAMAQPDWPANCHTTGFAFRDTLVNDQELENFIARNGAPIVFTPGTGQSDVAAFFEMAHALCRRLRLPGLFLSKAAPFGDEGGVPPIARRPFVDLGWCLPRARALVHHGGIGSAAQALRAGIPQFVVPGRFDQPDNALRIAELELGAAVLSRRVSIEDFAALIEAVLSDAAVKRKLARASASIRAQNGARAAANLIAELKVTRSFSDASPQPGAIAPSS